MREYGRNHHQAPYPESEPVSTTTIQRCASRREWLTARKLGLGGSDAAAALGLSPWKTQYELYLEKIGELEDQAETDAMYRGRLFEPVVRQMYCDATGFVVQRPEGIVRNSAIPFALADLDGLIGGQRVLECKTARDRRGWGEPGSDDIPLVYLLQVAHYMAVAEMQKADIAVLFGNFDLNIYSVAADAELQELLLNREAAFWEMVEKRTPPSPTTAGDALRQWPRARQKSAVIARENDRVIARLLVQMKGHIAQCEDWKAEAESRLKARIGEHEQLRYGEEVLATWGNTSPRQVFDAKGLAKDHPVVYKQYQKPGKPGRRFLLKENASCLKTGTHTTSLPTFNLPALPEPG